MLAAISYWELLMNILWMKKTVKVGVLLMLFLQGVFAPLRIMIRYIEIAETALEVSPLCVCFVRLG